MLLNVVEVKVLLATAFHAATLISLPNLQFDSSRNHSIVIDLSDRAIYIRQRLIDDLKLELENLAPL